MARGVERAGLAVENIRQVNFLLGQGCLVRLLPGRGGLAAGDHGHGSGCLLPAHHAGAGVGEGIEEIRLKAAATHAVVARAETGAGHQGDARHVQVAHRLYHLGAVLDHARPLGAGADDIAGGVLQEQHGEVRLVAQLQELGGLGGAGGVDRAVVADDAAGQAKDIRLQANGGGAVARLEIHEIGAVHYPGHQFPHVVGVAVIAGDHARQFVGVVEGFAVTAAAGRGAVLVPLQAVQQLAAHLHGLAVVLSQVFRQTGHRGVHFGAAQLLLGGDLPGGGLEQRRPGEEGAAVALHRDHVVAEARHVGAARGGGAVQDGDHGDARLAQFRQVAEQCPALGKTLHRVVQQVAAGAFHQVHERQLLLQRNHLRPLQSVAPGGGQGARLYTAVIHHHHAAHPADKADSGDDGAAGNRFFRVRVIQQVAGDVADGQQRHARVEQPCQALPRCQLAALRKARFAFFRDHRPARIEPLQVSDVGQHLLAVFVKTV